MMTKKRSHQRLESKYVDLSEFKTTIREVSVNGERLPLAIGDSLLINEVDHLVKTITSIQVHEDGRIAYMLEWFDSSCSDFKTEWVTSTELAFLNRAKKLRKTTTGFRTSNEEN